MVMQQVVRKEMSWMTWIVSRRAVLTALAGVALMAVDSRAQAQDAFTSQ